MQNVEGKRGTLRFEGGDVVKLMGLEPERRAPDSSVPHMRNSQQRVAFRRKALPDDLYAKWGSTSQGARARNQANEKELGGVGGKNNGGVSLA